LRVRENTDMGIQPFEGHTFVAFVDIAGFKQLMKRGDPAKRALDYFYRVGYETLRASPMAGRRAVEGLFVSDCAILFSTRDDDRKSSLWSLLSSLASLNRRMLEREYMLTTSIAYGDFRYVDRIEFDGIEKNQLSGHAYLDAFLDHERGKPKLMPGQARVCKDGLPDLVHQSLQQRESHFRCVEETSKHFYYYWMVASPDQIESFREAYSNAYELKYRGMLRALQMAACRGVDRPC
jgi:hypothetical protein